MRQHKSFHEIDPACLSGNQTRNLQIGSLTFVANLKLVSNLKYFCPCTQFVCVFKVSDMNTLVDSL